MYVYRAKLTILPLPPIPIIPNIPRPKNTIQQPPGHPIRPVLAIRRPAVKQRLGARFRAPPDLQDAPALALGADVVPEEGRADRGGRVVEDGFEEVAGVFVHYVIDVDCFVLFLTLGRSTEVGRVGGETGERGTLMAR